MVNLNPFAKPSKKEKFLRILKAIFLKRLPMNLLLLIIIIALSILGFQYIKPEGAPIGGVVGVAQESQCPECICEEEECEQDCDLCPIKTEVKTEEVVHYKCPHGKTVNNLEECEKYFPDVSEEYSGTVSGITLAIDDIKYEKDENNSGFVNRVDYTIINKGKLPIVPKIQVKVYEEWSLKIKAAPPNKVIDSEIVVNANDYVQRKDDVRIYFKGGEQTLRLLLINTLPDPDVEVLAVTRDFKLD